MEWLFWLLVIVGAVCMIVKKIDAAQKQKEAEDLKRTNPKVWAKIKQMEHEERLIEHDKKRMQHDQMKTGMDIGSQLLRSFMK